MDMMKCFQRMYRKWERSRIEVIRQLLLYMDMMKCFQRMYRKWERRL